MTERSRQHLALEWHVGYQEFVYTLESVDPVTLLEEREWIAWMRRNMPWMPLGLCLEGVDE